MSQNGILHGRTPYKNPLKYTVGKRLQINYHISIFFIKSFSSKSSLSQNKLKTFAPIYALTDSNPLIAYGLSLNFTTETYCTFFIVLTMSESYDGIFLPPACKIIYVNMQDKYDYMQNNLSRMLT